MLEALEDRTLMSAVQWIGAGGDLNWDTAQNWNTGAVPGSADDVQINTAGITVNHSAAVADAVNSLTSQAAIYVTAGSLTVATTATIGSDLSLYGGTFGGTGTTVVSGHFSMGSGNLRGSLQKAFRPGFHAGLRRRSICWIIET